MADSPTTKFEVPAEMRAAAEQSVEQARKAFDGFFSATQQAVSNVKDHADTAQAGAKNVQQKAVGFAERNVAASFDYAHKLLQAKSPDEVMRLHMEHVKAQMETLSEQARDLGRIAAVSSPPRSKA